MITVAAVAVLCASAKVQVIEFLGDAVEEGHFESGMSEMPGSGGKICEELQTRTFAGTPAGDPDEKGEVVGERGAELALVDRRTLI